MDSIRFDSYKFVEVPALSFYGQYAAVILSVLKGLSPVNGWQRIYKLEQDMQKFNDTYPEIWLTPGPYGLVDSTGEKVTYDDEDIKMSLEKIP